MTKRSGVIDRKALYVPTPSKWDWDKLDAAEIDRRLEQARDTIERLESWRQDIVQQRQEATRALFARLGGGAKLSEYTKSGGWKVPGQTEIEAMGKELVAIDKLSDAVRQAIETIENRLNPPPLLVR